MTSRSAEATIKGYYYQFDTTILKLLELKDSADHLDIEGIEDIDIHTATESTAVQCKYLSKANFTNSSVREPITLMLDHFVANSSLGLKYVLYAHFEEEIGGTTKRIALQDLKDMLTYKEKTVQKSHHVDNGISDAMLTNFLDQFSMVFGLKFEDQQQAVIAKLKSEFKCSDFEADSFYYNNSLRKVIDISILKDATKRNLSRGAFITAIDTVNLVFNEWYIRLKSKAAFLQQLKKSISDTRANLASKTRHIIIGKEILDAGDTELNFVGLVENVIHGNYRMGHAMRNARPVTIILDTDQDQLNHFKKQLIKAEIPFNDGFENITFSPELFDKPPVNNVTASGIKLSKSSYHIRLISLDTLKASFTALAKPKVVFNFSKKEPAYERSSEYALFDIKHCDTLKDISNLI